MRNRIPPPVSDGRPAPNPRSGVPGASASRPADGAADAAAVPGARVVAPRPLPDPSPPGATPPGAAPRRSGRGRRRLVRLGYGLGALLGLVAYGVVHHETGAGRPPHCSVVDTLSSGTGGDGDGDGSDGPYVLQPQQAANAATISAVGEARGLDEWAVTIAIATAMQESSLRNIDHGDRDSLGLFQQRPSMGWGSEAEIMDPVYSAGRFYDHLVEVPDYADLPLTVAAQTVQRSAFPDEYAKHEPRAAMLAGAFTGRDSATLSCAFTEDPEAAPGEAGELVRRLEREFGEWGAAPTALRPTVESSRSGGSEVVEVVVPVPREAGEGGESATRTARRVAHWAVAHARELGVTRVTDGERRWEAATSARGWRAEGAGGPGPGTEVRIALRR